MFPLSEVEIILDSYIFHDGSNPPLKHVKIQRLGAHACQNLSPRQFQVQ